MAKRKKKQMSFRDIGMCYRKWKYENVSVAQLTRDTGFSRAQITTKLNWIDKKREGNLSYAGRTLKLSLNRLKDSNLSIDILDKTHLIGDKLLNKMKNYRTKYSETHSSMAMNNAMKCNCDNCKLWGSPSMRREHIKKMRYQKKKILGIQKELDRALI